MARELSAEEVRQEVIAAMGKGLGQLYYELWNQVVWLHLKWKEFLALYDDPARIEKLNRTAPAFFYLVQRSLFEDILLHLCRLTDPVEMRGRTNLTIQALVPEMSDEALGATLEAAVATAVDSIGFAREWRNRRIAHKDLRTLRGEHPTPLPPGEKADVDNALVGIRGVMRVLSLHYLNSEAAYGAVANTWGAESLLFYLGKGLDAVDDEERRWRGEP